MKRICSLALLAAAVFFLCCRGAQAEPPVTVEDAAKWQLEQNLTPPVPLYGKLANNVNVRAAPGTDGAKIAAVSGSSVAALARVSLSGDKIPWELCWIEDLHRLGWVYSRFIDRSLNNEGSSGEAFEMLLNADQAVSDAALEKLWGKPLKEKQLTDSDGDKYTSRRYKDLKLVLREPQQQGGRRLVTRAVTATPKAGFGGLYIGTDWCDRKYVKKYLGQPDDAKPNDKVWDCTIEAESSFLRIEFAPNNTIKKLEYIMDAGYREEDL